MLSFTSQGSLGGPKQIYKGWWLVVQGCQVTMAMGRNLRVYHNLGHAGPGQGYSLILEHKALGEMLPMEDFAIDNLSKLP